MLGGTGDPSCSIIPHRGGKCKSAGGFCAELFPWGIFLFIYLRADAGELDFFYCLRGRALRIWDNAGHLFFSPTRLAHKSASPVSALLKPAGLHTYPLRFNLPSAWEALFKFG
jgi:hypothetical protein